jgi:hypothetical protein
MNKNTAFGIEAGLESGEVLSTCGWMRDGKNTNQNGWNVE